MNCRLVNYADDVSVVVQEDTLVKLLKSTQLIYDKLCSWFSDNRLVINQTKTSYVLFANPRSVVLDVSVLSNDFLLSNNITLLGVVIDSNLRWEDHVNCLCGKLGRVCFALRSLRKSCDLDTLKTFYYANFISIIRYGVIHWGCSPHAYRVFLMQKRALRVIFNLGPLESCRGVFTENKFLTFYGIYILDVLCFVYKHYNLFNKNNVSHNFNTRQENYLFTSKHSTAIFQKSLEYRGCFLYNKLPANIRSSNSFYLFKKRTKEYLLQRNCYSLDDYIN